METTFDTQLDPENPVITDAHYREVKIPKYKLVGGREVIKGFRTLSIPCDQLMQMQKELLHQLNSCHGVFSSNAAHAFMPKRSIKTMAIRHVDKPTVIRIDIKDFFPSINPAMLRTAMLDANYPNRLIRKTLQICFYKGGLPQGAPTSPLLSNIVGRMIDKRILALCRSWRLVSVSRRTYRMIAPDGSKRRVPYDRVASIGYSRYADDLVFSSTYEHLTHIIEPVRYILKNCGFSVNYRKINVNRQSSRQVVCGITVNEKLSKPKPYRKRVRAMIHNIIMDTAYERCPEGYYIDRKTREVLPINVQRLNGLVAHITDICNEQGDKMRRLLTILDEIRTLDRDKWSQFTKDYLQRHPNVLFV